MLEAIDRLSLFFSNEGADEMSTASLRYIFACFLLAQHLLQCWGTGKQVQLTSLLYAQVHTCFGSSTTRAEILSCLRSAPEPQTTAALRAGDTQYRVSALTRNRFQERIIQLYMNRRRRQQMRQVDKDDSEQQAGGGGR